MPAIAIQSLTKTYPARGNARAVRAFDNVSYNSEHGEFFGLLGPNGASKTTIISLCAALAHATQSSSRVHGVDVTQDFANARRQFGFVP